MRLALIFFVFVLLVPFSLSFANFIPMGIYFLDENDTIISYGFAVQITDQYVLTSKNLVMQNVNLYSQIKLKYRNDIEYQYQVTNVSEDLMEYDVLILKIEHIEEGNPICHPLYSKPNAMKIFDNHNYLKSVEPQYSLINSNTELYAGNYTYIRGAEGNESWWKILSTVEEVQNNFIYLKVNYFIESLLGSPVWRSDNQLVGIVIDSIVNDEVIRGKAISIGFLLTKMIKSLSYEEDKKYIDSKSDDKNNIEPKKNESNIKDNIGILNKKGNTSSSLTKRQYTEIEIENFYNDLVTFCTNTTNIPLKQWIYNLRTFPCNIISCRNIMITSFIHQIYDLSTTKFIVIVTLVLICMRMIKDRWKNNGHNNIKKQKFIVNRNVI